MKKLSLILAIAILSNKLAISQVVSNLELFNNYDFEKATQILKDSIWEKKQLWKKTDIYNREAEKVEFLIIPIFHFDEKRVSNYNENYSLINYLRTDSNTISAIVLNNGKFIGYIKANYTEIYEKQTSNYMDSSNISITDFLQRPKEKNNRFDWVISSETVFCENTTHFNFFKSIYNIIKEHNPKYFFMLPYYAWELWFIEDNNLKAFSINRDKIIEEKELIENIKTVKVEDRSLYYLEYKSTK